MTRAVVAQGIAKKQQRELEHLADAHKLERAEGRRTCVLRPRPQRSASAHVRQAKLVAGRNPAAPKQTSDQVITEDPAQHGSVAGAPKNRQRILSVRRSGWSRNAGPQQWY